MSSPLLIETAPREPCCLVPAGHPHICQPALTAVAIDRDLRRMSSTFRLGFLLLLMAGVCLPAVSFAEADSMPANARMERFGWSCVTGYMKKGSECREIVVPENAFLMERAYPDGWACHWGYR
ncbi:MAG: hypothetical protein KDI36_11650, partial [Pseudomonadales bacterium]|nr:hypothetical protein [Pseudomonadales bacterium]